MTKAKGKIIQIIGPVVDVEFSEGQQMPPIGNALEIIERGLPAGRQEKIILEVARHLEPGRVRAISLSSTDGLSRGAEVWKSPRGFTLFYGRAF